MGKSWRSLLPIVTFLLPLERRWYVAGWTLVEPHGPLNLASPYAPRVQWRVFSQVPAGALGPEKEHPLGEFPLC